VDSQRFMTPEQRKDLRAREAALPLEDQKRAFLYRQLPALQAHLSNIERNDLAARPNKLEIRATCNSEGQYIGMASHDLYLLDAENNFSWNFFKGASGLWLLLLVVLGLNIALSTYLSAIISWLAGLFWLLLGLVRDFIGILTNKADPAGGGPMESLYRLTHRQGLGAPGADTPAYNVFLQSDDIVRVFFKGLRFVIPDFDRFWYADYVAEGFNIGFSDNIAIGMVYLAAWIIPFALLGYYTMKWRELASSQ
jgi:hypothetical protein